MRRTVGDHKDHIRQQRFARSSTVVSEDSEQPEYGEAHEHHRDQMCHRPHSNKEKIHDKLWPIRTKIPCIVLPALSSTTLDDPGCLRSQVFDPKYRDDLRIVGEQVELETTVNLQWNLALCSMSSWPKDH